MVQYSTVQVQTGRRGKRIIIREIIKLDLGCGDYLQGIELAYVTYIMLRHRPKMAVAI